MAAHIGAYAYSYALGAYLSVSTVDYIFLANTQATLVNQFSIAIDDSRLFSRGGAVAVEAGYWNESLVSVSFSTFFNCAVQGWNIFNMGARGGAVHVMRAACIEVTRTMFTNCSIVNAVSGGVASGGSAMCAAFSGDAVINECVFDATDGQDASESSNGLLVLALSTSLVQCNVSRCDFMSSMVVPTVVCVHSDGAMRSVGNCNGPKMSLMHSRILQVQSPTFPSLNDGGGVMMSFPNSKTVSFNDSYLHCALSRPTAFKERTVAP